MKPCVAVVLLSSGCVSFGAGVTMNAALDDAPVRRSGGALQIGTMTEIVEDQLIGQLLYSRDVGPLGNGANAIGAWGARITSVSRGARPGLYLHGAYGQNDAASEPTATSIIAGAGITYGKMMSGRHNRGWAGISAGLVYHRSRQELIDDNQPGHFLGLEVAISAGFDVFGPMYARQD